MLRSLESDVHEKRLEALMQSTNFGPGAWLQLHSNALQATTPESKEHFRWQTTNFIKHGILCSTCHKHANDYLEHNPLPTRPLHINSKDKRDLSMFIWTVDFHNTVNTRLDKPRLTYTEALRLYEKTPELVCTGNCSQESNQLNINTNQSTSPLSGDQTPKKRRFAASNSIRGKAEPIPSIYDGVKRKGKSNIQ